MMSPTADLENRKPVWEALSEFFLDTEPDSRDYDWIATTLADSAYSSEQLESILYGEVYPVLIPNLLCLFGEWGMFEPNWLASAILDYKARRIRWPVRLQMNRWLVRDHWNEVRTRVSRLRNGKKQFVPTDG